MLSKTVLKDFNIIFKPIRSLWQQKERKNALRFHKRGQKKNPTILSLLPRGHLLQRHIPKASSLLIAAIPPPQTKHKKIQAKKPNRKLAPPGPPPTLKFDSLETALLPQKKHQCFLTLQRSLDLLPRKQSFALTLSLAIVWGFGARGSFCNEVY